jgi:hypothetical protein
MKTSVAEWLVHCDRSVQTTSVPVTGPSHDKHRASLARKTTQHTTNPSQARANSHLFLELHVEQPHDRPGLVQYRWHRVDEEFKVSKADYRQH